MAAIPLSDEETVLIFAGEALSNYEGLDAGAQRTVIECLQQVMGAETPPTAQRYERIANLDIIRCGDQPRLYTKMVENIPEENVTYHVIFSSTSITSTITRTRRKPSTVAKPNNRLRTYGQSPTLRM